MDAEETKRKVEEERLRQLRAKQAAQAETARLLLIAAERCAENGEASCPGSPAALAAATAKALLAKAQDKDGGGASTPGKKKKEVEEGREEELRSTMTNHREGGRGQTRRRSIRSSRFSSPEGQEDAYDEITYTCLQRYFFLFSI